MPLLVISYSHVDRKQVAAVVSLLRGAMPGRIHGAVYWDQDFEAGEDWFEQMRASIGQAERLFVFWCGHASTSSQVAREVACARDLGRPVVPVLLDNTPLRAPLAAIHGIDLRGSIHHSSSWTRRHWQYIGGAAAAVVAVFTMLGTLLLREAPSPLPAVPAAVEIRLDKPEPSDGSLLIQALRSSVSAERAPRPQSPRPADVERPSSTAPSTETKPAPPSPPDASSPEGTVRFTISPDLMATIDTMMPPGGQVEIVHGTSETDREIGAFLQTEMEKVAPRDAAGQVTTRFVFDQRDVAGVTLRFSDQTPEPAPPPPAPRWLSAPAIAALICITIAIAFLALPSWVSRRFIVRKFGEYF